jgi:hypothetical protein
MAHSLNAGPYETFRNDAKLAQYEMLVSTLSGRYNNYQLWKHLKSLALKEFSGVFLGCCTKTHCVTSMMLGSVRRVAACLLGRRR